MQQCTQCGASLPEGAKFCRACGTSLSQTNAPAAQPDGVPCPECGVVNKPGARFCKGCGKALAQPAASQAEPPQLDPPREQPRTEQSPVGQPAAEQPSDEVPCPHCDSANKPQARFCRNCGQPLAALTAPTVQEDGKDADAADTRTDGDGPAETGSTDTDPTDTGPADTGPPGGDNHNRNLLLVLAAVALLGIAIASYVLLRSGPATEETSGGGAAVASVPAPAPQPAPVAPAPQPAPHRPDTSAQSVSKAHVQRPGGTSQPDREDQGGAVQQPRVPGQMEAEILRQLEEKKRRLGVQ